MRKSKGFTLVEILIVIMVIGVLAGIAIPAVRGIRDQARISQAEGDLSTLRSATEAFQTTTDGYPDPAKGGGGTAGYVLDDAVKCKWQADLVGASPRVLQKKLSDPFASTKGHSYFYVQDGDSQNWVMWSVGPDQESLGYTVTKAPDATVTKTGDDIVVASVPVLE